VDSLRAGFYDQRERYSKPITTVHEGPMLRQLLVGTAVSVCNIAIHALCYVPPDPRQRTARNRVPRQRRVSGGNRTKRLKQDFGNYMLLTTRLKM
jgi:hypothetical protein